MNEQQIMNKKQVMNKKQAITTKELTKMTLLTALLCVSSYIIIPLPFSLASITAQSIIVNLIGFLLKPTQAFTTVTVYILIGLVGVPVFSGGIGGPGKLFGPTGGYIFGYLVAATVISILRGSTFKIKRCLLLSVLVGMPIIYLLGSVYMKMITGMSLEATLTSAVLPFIPLDILKCFISVILGKSIQRIAN